MTEFDKENGNETIKHKQKSGKTWHKKSVSERFVDEEDNEDFERQANDNNNVNGSDLKERSNLNETSITVTAMKSMPAHSSFQHLPIIDTGTLEVDALKIKGCYLMILPVSRKHYYERLTQALQKMSIMDDIALSSLDVSRLGIGMFYLIRN